MKIAFDIRILADFVEGHVPAWDFRDVEFDLDISPDDLSGLTEEETENYIREALVEHIESNVLIAYFIDNIRRKNVTESS